MTEPHQIAALAEDIETFVETIVRDLPPAERGVAITMALEWALARHLVAEFEGYPSEVMSACALAQRQLGEYVRLLFAAGPAND